MIVNPEVQSLSEMKSAEKSYTNLCKDLQRSAKISTFFEIFTHFKFLDFLFIISVNTNDHSILQARGL